MVNKIVLVDFAGTLVKADIIEEANHLRTGVLQRSIPSREEYAHSEKLYQTNREFVEKLTGLKSSMTIRYRENDLDFLDLSGEQVQNQIATTLFQIGMYMTAKKHGRDIIPAGFLDQLQRIKKQGYALAIVSGVRTDIISGMLQIADIPLQFDYILGQPPVLGVDNISNTRVLQKYGSIVYVIGDKLSDLEIAGKVGAKSIFVKWGHATGGEEDFADYTIRSPKELETIIQ